MFYFPLNLFIFRLMTEILFAVLIHYLELSSIRVAKRSQGPRGLLAQCW